MTKALLSTLLLFVMVVSGSAVSKAQVVDLVILVDRSASISANDYLNARNLVREFAGQFTLGPSDTNVLIAHFDVDVEVVLEFYQGVSQVNIDAATNAMSCACGSPGLDFSLRPWEVPRPSAVVCCARRSSISKALEGAGEFLANARAAACKAVLVVSDGRHNTLIDTVTPCNGGACALDLASAIQDLVADYPGIAIYGVGVGDTDHFKMATIDGGRYNKLTEGAAVDCPSVPPTPTPTPTPE